MSEPEPNALKPSTSVESVDSNTPFKPKHHDGDSNKEHMMRTPVSNDDLTYSMATMVIKDGDHDLADLHHIALEMKPQTTETLTTHRTDPQEEEKKELRTPVSGSNEYSHSHSGPRMHNDSAAESITTHTDFSSKNEDAIHQDSKENLLETTTLRHDHNDVEIGTTEAHHHHHRKDSSRKPPPRRMPSISYNAAAQSNDLAALRRASRRKWWSPTRVCDWCMHKVFFGKIMVMILTWTTVIDYSKDLYVAYHMLMNDFIWEFFVTLSILFLSLRLMLYLRATDDSSAISFCKLLIFYLPGSVYADFQIDRFSDIGVCVFWEIAILFGTPFVPFFLIYLALRKSVSLFCSGGRSFENPYLLSYAVVECIFETIPQLSLQSYLYFTGRYNEISMFVFIIAWCVSILVLIKIPIVVWYNWRIVYKLSFKRRHCGEIISLKYHPQQDLIATGSWDHTVLINSIISSKKKTADDDDDTREQVREEIDIKAKRVLDHHYNINCIAFDEYDDADIIAVAGQGVELFNWRHGKSIATLPKTRERDQLRRKKRHRTKEVKQVLFAPVSTSTDGHTTSGRRLIWCQGKNVLVWDLSRKKELLKIKCIQGNRLGDVETIDISPNGKYIAAGLYSNQIKVYNSYNRDCIRVLGEDRQSQIMCCKFDRQGKYIISGGADSVVRLFDLRSGEECATFNAHESDVMCLAMDQTNRYIASGGRDKTLNIIYLETMKPLKGWIPYKTQRDIRCVDFSPYGDTVACATEDHQVHILTLPKECWRSNYKQKQKQKIIENKNNNKNDDRENERKSPHDVDSSRNHHQKQYSNMDVITTNDYNEFDPKEHKIF